MQLMFKKWNLKRVLGQEYDNFEFCLSRFFFWKTFRITWKSWKSKYFNFCKKWRDYLKNSSCASADLLLFLIALFSSTLEKQCSIYESDPTTYETILKFKIYLLYLTYLIPRLIDLLLDRSFALVYIQESKTARDVWSCKTLFRLEVQCTC